MFHFHEQKQKRIWGKLNSLNPVEYESFLKIENVLKQECQYISRRIHPEGALAKGNFLNPADSLVPVWRDGGRAGIRTCLVEFPGLGKSCYLLGRRGPGILRMQSSV